MSRTSVGEVYLHGTLHIYIDSASDLPNMDWTWFNSRNRTDGFVMVKIVPLDMTLAETKIVNDSLNPVWNEDFTLQVCHPVKSIRLLVADGDYFRTENIGYVDINAKDLLEGRKIDDWYDIVGIKDGKPQGSLNFKMWFTPHDEISERFLTEKAYFDIRKSNTLRLYQNANTPNLPIFQGVTNPDDSEYEPTRCWRDMYEAISNAKKIIYIAGWSVWADLCMLRGDEDPSKKSHLGELLTRKAEEEGMKVNIMIWDNHFSDFSLTSGLLETHDEETEQYFENTKVKVALVRVIQAKNKMLKIKDQIMPAIYTHHQKFVLVDSETENSDDRHLVAFLGGIDLAKGRYETPEYKLFDLSEHGEIDFYQNCATGATAQTGPRQPWHDIHCRVEGPITKDILHNFESRWQKQAEDKIGCLYRWEDNEIIDLDYVPSNSGHDNDLFDMQLYRLSTKLGCEVDNSIMVPAKHTIPNEIAYKIVQAIQKGERFRAYIVIPLYPEGDPSSSVSQEILNWQFSTMKSMYQTIGKALKKAGSDAHPKDYLLFFSPCKTESEEQRDENLEMPNEKTAAFKACQSLRHPIYVHSKMMIVDDDFIILGSANINHRSMAGSRDTEIAVGATQPSYQASKDETPRGAIHTFRLALWSNHLGGFREEFRDPVSQECLDLVRNITEDYQQFYASGDKQFSLVHLLPYPIDVNQDGSVDHTPGWEKFPDWEGTNASVLGKGPRTGLPNFSNYITS